MSKECIHDLAEMETACADGLCPICMQAENERLKELIEKYGTEPSEFDWGILETIDELEQKLAHKNEKIEAIKRAIALINQYLKEIKE